MKNVFTFLLLLGFIPSIAWAGEVQLYSYAVEKQSLKAPVMKADARGEKRQFDSVYIVRIKGQIPVHRAVPVQLFIGDHPIREYGSTGDGIYFKVYDVALLRRWHGKSIRYAVKPNEIRDSGLTFHSDALPE